MTDNHLISRAILRYHPSWDPPLDVAVWNKCLCPFHGDESPSASVSYDLEGFRCFACGVRGDAISIIRHMEEVTFADAVRIAESLPVGGDDAVQTESARKPRPRVSLVKGSRGGSKVRSRIRGRPTPWA